MKTMEAWQERVIKERDDLTVKLDKLTDFLATKKDAMSSKVCDQLTRQFNAMSQYERILAERIADF